MGRLWGRFSKARLWAEDVKSHVRYFRAQLDVIEAREEVCEAVSTASVGVDGTRLTRQVHLANSLAEQPVLLFEETLSVTSPDRADGPAARKKTIAEARCLLHLAEGAASGNPRYLPLASWWTGAGPEGAWKHLHRAEALVARLYNPDEVACELPDAVRRVEAALANEDRTRKLALSLADRTNGSPRCSPELLSVIINKGHEAADRQRARIRTFRNVTLVGFVLMVALVVVLIAVGRSFPAAIPLCVSHDGLTVCPTGLNGPPISVPSWDVPTVALLGAVGGMISTAVFVRGLYANPTPYNVAVPLALLKIPTGCVTAIVGVLFLAGGFFSGFGVIDGQAQILSYAVLFGFAQQIVTQAADQRAKRFISDLPTKSRDSSLNDDRSTG
jgi:hypothetical protein